MLRQLDSHAPKIIPATSVQDLNPRPCGDNAHTSVLPFEMESIEPGDGEIPTRKLTWKPLGFLIHIIRRTTDDRFPIALWEVWFGSTLRVPIPVLIRLRPGGPIKLIGPPQQCVCNSFRYDSY